VDYRLRTGAMQPECTPPELRPFYFVGCSFGPDARCLALAQSFCLAKSVNQSVDWYLLHQYRNVKDFPIVCDKNEVFDADVVVSDRIFVGVSTHIFLEVDGYLREALCRTHHIICDSGELSYQWWDGWVFWA
jgi:hypothetical protein